MKKVIPINRINIVFFHFHLLSNKNLCMKYWLFLFVFIFYSSLYAQSDQLIVWKNEAKPVLKIEDIEKIKQVAEKNGLEFILKEVNDGVPPEINFTPSIVFQNANGSSFYYGRYLNYSRMKNFIRASKLSHQKPISSFKKEIFVWKDGKTDVMAPLKLTALKGELPKKYNEAEFIKNAKQKISEGMSSFQLMNGFESTNRTRSFYFNLYPYVDETGYLVITAEIFSQYNCVKPVFQQFGNGLVSGKWKHRDQLFKKAGLRIELLIKSLMSDSEIGDAMRSIPENLPEKTWEQLQVGLPVATLQNETSNKTISVLPSNWEVELPTDKTQPFCIFSFWAPLDNYAGEVKNMVGTFTLKNENQLSSASGKFEVKTADVTMGAEDFDYEVQNKMLKKEDFPVSSFAFDTFEVTDDALQLGTPADFIAKGKFTMLGRTIQLFAEGQIMPKMTKNDELRLQVNCTFNLPLFESYRVEGPDGPAPAKNTLQYFMKFNLKPIID